MTPKQIVLALTLAGWNLDKYQHPCKQVKENFLRIRLAQGKCLLERRVFRSPTPDNPSRTGWILMDSVPQAEVSVTDSCQVKVGNRLF